MKICVTSQGDHLDAAIDPRFGRCQYFMIVDTETMSFEALRNGNVTGMGGVGIQSGRLMAEKGVEVVLTGNVGPNASQTLEAAGIRVVVHVTGSVKEAVASFKKDQMS